jgi:hypothetical protein
MSATTSAEASTHRAAVSPTMVRILTSFTSC